MFVTFTISVSCHSGEGGGDFECESEEVREELTSNLNFGKVYFTSVA